VADWRQFEDFGAGFDPEVFDSECKDRPAICAVCEAMLPEAVDGALGEAEQRAFERHVDGCRECAHELAEAQRGAAWLSMLKSEAPQPPAGMLERILAETTGLASGGARIAPARSAVPAAVVTPQPVPQWPAARPAQPAPAWALSSLWRSAVSAFRVENSQASLQPRLAMTAAMAFFSIALTLNLTGVRLRDLPQDLTSSGLRRAAADVGASATRTFQNNRMVYQVESRVSELRSDEAPAAGQGGADQESSR
jgi:anti-sigma factor RsiW